MIDERVFPKERIRRLANMVAGRALDDVLNVIDLSERFPDPDLREEVLDEVLQIATWLKQRGERAPRVSEQAAARYAEAVVSALAADFPALKDRTLGRIVPEEVARQAEAPMRSFEVIVTYTRGWRLVPDSRDRRRVWLVCFLDHPTDADRQRGRRINTALQTIDL